MAQQAETIIKITNTLKEYKAQIESLKASMVGLSRESQEYKDMANQCAAMQQKLNDVIRDSKTGTDAAKGSYNGLVAEMAELRKAWKATSDEAERDALGKQIKSINEKLKTMDAGIGNFQRNVGNYTNSFKEAFGAMGGSVGKLATSIGSLPTVIGTVNTALLKLAANPIGAVIAAIGVAIMVVVGAFQALKKGVTSSEENMNKWKKAIAPIEGIVNALTKALQKVAGVLLDAVSKAIKVAVELLTGFLNFAANVLDAVGMDDTANSIRVAVAEVNKATKESEEIAKKREELAKRQRELTVDEANAEKELAKQRAILNDREGKSLKERQAAMDAIRKIETDINTKKLEQAKAQHELIKLENQQNDSTAEAKQREAEAQAEIARAEAALAETEREYHSNQKTLAREQKRQSSEREKEQNKEIERQRTLLSLQKQLTQEIGKTYLQGSRANYSYRIKEIELARDTELKGLEKIFKKTSELEKAKALVRERYEIQLEELERQNILDNAKFQLEVDKNLTTESLNFAKDLLAKGGILTDDNKFFSVQIDMISELKDYYFGLATAQQEYANQLKVYANKYKEEFSAVIDDINKETGLLSTDEILQNWDKIPEELRNRFEKPYALYLEYINKYNEETKKATVLSFQSFDVEVQAAITKLETSFSRIPRTASEQAYIAMETQKIMLDNLHKNLEETDDEFKARRIQEQQKYYELQLQYADAFIDDYVELNERIYDRNHLKTKDSWISEDSEITKSKLRIEQAKYENEALEELYNKGIINLQEYSKRKREIEKAQAKASFEHTNAVMNAYMKMGQGISNVMNTVASVMTDNIKKKKEDGKISEEEAEKEFDRIKKVQIASTIISTIAGAIGAFMQDKKAYPAPYNYIIAGIDMAATLAAGYAQVKQIESTTIGSDSSSASGNGTASVAVNPLLNSELDGQSLQSIQTTVGLESQNTDSRVYILQSDITDSNNQVRVRQSNTTF